jgi:ribosomal protein S18 acetylase RimI-like enzyme
MDQFSCRIETPEDEPFIRQLMFETLTDQLEASSWPDAVREPILDAQYRVRRQGFRKSAEDRPGTILLVNGEPVGWYVAADLDYEIRLVNLVVLSKHRGKGIGSAVLRELVTGSNHAHKTLTLSVAMNNQRAFDLYVRMGFRQTGDDGVHYFMERPAQ